MFNTILVPLDGSALAEQALAPASRLAARFGGELLLLSVVVPERPLPGLPYLVPRAGDEAAGPSRPRMEEAEAYLAGLKLSDPGLRVRTLVLGGAPAELIIAAGDEGGADLIVMSTHGRSGLMRLLYGSVAEEVLRGATVPVLLVPSRACSRDEAGSPTWRGAWPRGAVPFKLGAAHPPRR
jgi:nucleotide-binding universal stress UspA family protein